MRMMKKTTFLIIFKYFLLFLTMWMHAQACVCWSNYTTKVIVNLTCKYPNKYYWISRKTHKCTKIKQYAFQTVMLELTLTIAWSRRIMKVESLILVKCLANKKILKQKTKKCPQIKVLLDRFMSHEWQFFNYIYQCYQHFLRFKTSTNFMKLFFGALMMIMKGFIRTQITEHIKH